jgi:UDPglucose--hexose-1-phosphate uridylyltransferase
VSNPHPHCQIYAVDFTINVVKKELDAAAEYRKEKNRNVFSDIIDAEKKDDIRIIAENKGAIAFIPYFARFAYETYVFPKKRHATLITMTDEELYDLAKFFKQLQENLMQILIAAFLIFLLLRKHLLTVMNTRIITCT